MDLNIFLSLKSGITHFIAPAMWSGFAPFLAKVLYTHGYELANKSICSLFVNKRKFKFQIVQEDLQVRTMLKM